MSTSENTTGSGSQAVGRVVIIYDDARAISPDGMVRLLSADSPVYANDRIVTEKDGKVSIILDDAAQTRIDLGGMSDVIIDEDIFGGAGSEEVAEAAADIEQVREAFFFEDIDLAAESEAVAADVDRMTHESEVATSPAETVNVIFDHSDYAELDSSNPDDPLDNFIDNGEDGTS